MALPSGIAHSSKGISRKT